jgi:hypothetical protein
MGVPGKKEDERGVDEAREDRGIENRLPHESRGEDCATTKDEEEDGRSADEV